MRSTLLVDISWKVPLTKGRLIRPLDRAGIEDLREKREEVNRSIAKDEEEKGERAIAAPWKRSGASIFLLP